MDPSIPFVFGRSTALAAATGRRGSTGLRCRYRPSRRECHLSAGRPIWNPVLGATSYELEWLLDGTSTTFRNLTCSTRCTLRTDLEGGRIRDRAGNEVGWSSWSGWVDVPLATTAPSQPRNVDAAPHGTRQLRVAWSPPSNSGSSAIKHYTVRYSRGAIDADPEPWRSRLYTTTSTSHTSPNLRYGVTYTVTVTACQPPRPVQQRCHRHRHHQSPSDYCAVAAAQCGRGASRHEAASGCMVAAVELRQFGHQALHSAILPWRH